MALPKPMRKGNGALVSSDQRVSEAIIEMAKEVAAQEGIPLSGITILGGRPYINVTGLDAKIKALEEKGLIKAEPIVEEIERPSRENGNRAGFKCTVTLFDRKAFQEALQKIKSPSVEIIRELKEAFTYRYQDVGWASPDSVKMSTMKSLDFITMMASRRASNRAKRAAVGCGLTSVEEMDIEPEAVIDVEAEAPARKNSKRPSLKDLQARVWELAQKLSYDSDSFTAYVKQKYGTVPAKLTEEQLKELEQEFLEGLDGNAQE